MNEADPVREFVGRYLSHQAEWSSEIGAVVPDPTTAERRVRDGLPWIEPSEIRPDARTATAVFNQILSDLRGSAVSETPALEWLQDLSAKGFFSAPALLAGVLRRDTSEVCRLADAASLPAQALHLLGVFLARPFLATARCGFDPSLVGPESARGWCPGCGFGAALAVLQPEEGHRLLWCRYCGLQWRVKRLRCPWCRNEDSRRLGYFTVEGVPGRRVDFCEECRHYVKTRDLRESDPEGAGFLGEAEDLLTVELDAAAVREGFLPMAGAGAQGADDRHSVVNRETGRC